MTSTQSIPKHRRRNKLPKPAFQMRLGACFIGFCALSLVVQSLVVAAQFSQIAHEFAEPAVDPMHLILVTLGKSLAIGALMILPALGLIALHCTFRMAGPIFRMERHLRQVAGGEWPGDCHIRKGDEHQELCDLMNRALRSARQMEPEVLEELPEEQAA
ncbi:MAG: hypothetical protein R3F33_02170 [Planctomycetota bacterium]